MHRLATVHARDNQLTDQRRHDTATAYLNKRFFYLSKVRRLKTIKKLYRNIIKQGHTGKI